MTLAIGPSEILLFAVFIPILVFLLGYWLGKKSGYSKRVKEEQKK